ncbi:unnamed protein product, partial [Phaeothamnion confervicola]
APQPSLEESAGLADALAPEALLGCEIYAESIQRLFRALAAAEDSGQADSGDSSAEGAGGKGIGGSGGSGSGSRLRRRPCLSSETVLELLADAGLVPVMFGEPEILEMLRFVAGAAADPAAAAASAIPATAATADAATVAAPAADTTVIPAGAMGTTGATAPGAAGEVARPLRLYKAHIECLLCIMAVRLLPSVRAEDSAGAGTAAAADAAIEDAALGGGSALPLSARFETLMRAPVFAAVDATDSSTGAAADAYDAYQGNGLLWRPVAREGEVAGQTHRNEIGPGDDLNSGHRGVGTGADNSGTGDSGWRRSGDVGGGSSGGYSSGAAVGVSGNESDFLGLATVTAASSASACGTALFEELLEPDVMMLFDRYRTQWEAVFGQYSQRELPTRRGSHDGGRSGGGGGGGSGWSEPGFLFEDCSIFLQDFEALGAAWHGCAAQLHNIFLVS